MPQFSFVDGLQLYNLFYVHLLCNNLALDYQFTNFTAMRFWHMMIASSNFYGEIQCQIILKTLHQVMKEDRVPYESGFQHHPKCKQVTPCPTGSPTLTVDSEKSHWP